ncbi:MAG: acyl-CoA dehydrogenase family protein [Candidatus Binataceae bacterium]|nr:acyl-CoA dehydrogenase family protein [Candidatus Binataceae bacterium]
MDFSFTPEQEAFRTKLRGFLDQCAAELFPPGGMSSLGVSLLDVTDDAQWERLLEYHRRLYRAGYVALHWPKEHGGAAADPVTLAIFQDETLRLGLPMFGANQLAIDRIGPTIIMLGTDQQRRRYLPKMLSGGEIWCQGYSEPNAGSDLAALKTSAVLENDHFVINGQKVWTSIAHRAQFQCLLVRTDTNAPKHRGISYLLVDMRTPGITIRPLVQITGERGFNEVFYDNVRVPKDNLVGALNDGWRASIATLMYERISGGARHPVERDLGELIALSKQVEFEGVAAYRHPYVRQKLAQFLIDARTVRLARYRALDSMRHQAPGAQSSFGKLLATELNLRMANFADELLGAHNVLAPGSFGAIGEGRWSQRLLGARALTIAAGSTEVQHNIIGERILGLPKE